ncbi:hypothetical protein ABK040_003254 [Willaertia magna]
MKTLAIFSVLLICFVCVAFSQLTEEEQPAINFQIIKQVNSNPKSTWKAGINKKFINKNLKYAKQLLGLRGMSKDTPVRYNEEEMKMIERYNRAKAYYQTKFGKLKVSVPDQFDSRTQWPGCVHPIRNQEQCGSCWAFSASEVLSDRFCIATFNRSQAEGGRIDVVLAPQDMVSCNWYNMGCDGGILNLAWLYLEHTGIVPDACLPYVSGSGNVPSCPKTCVNGNYTNVALNSVKYKASTFHNLGLFEFWERELKIQEEIIARGPVQTGFSVYQDFMNYKSGVYSHQTGSFLGGHAVKIVGWGVDKGTPYWIVANSWGPDWGLDGFFWMKRGNNECSIESGAIAGPADLKNVPKKL